MFNEEYSDTIDKEKQPTRRSRIAERIARIPAVQHRIQAAVAYQNHLAQKPLAEIQAQQAMYNDGNDVLEAESIAEVHQSELGSQSLEVPDVDTAQNI